MTIIGFIIIGLVVLRIATSEAARFLVGALFLFFIIGLIYLSACPGAREALHQRQATEKAQYEQDFKWDCSDGVLRFPKKGWKPESISDEIYNRLCWVAQRRKAQPRYWTKDKLRSLSFQILQNYKQDIGAYDNQSNIYLMGQVFASWEPKEN